MAARTTKRPIPRTLLMAATLPVIRDVSRNPLPPMADGWTVHNPAAFRIEADLGGTAPDRRLPGPSGGIRLWVPRMRRADDEEPRRDRPASLPGRRAERGARELRLGAGRSR